MPCPQGTDVVSPSPPQFRSRQSRQVRCDAASLGVPCTNCTAFQIECRIPTPKRKKAQSTTFRPRDSDRYPQRSQALGLSLPSVPEKDPSISRRALLRFLGGRPCRLGGGRSGAIHPFPPPGRTSNPALLPPRFHVACDADLMAASGERPTTARRFRPAPARSRAGPDLPPPTTPTRPPRRAQTRRSSRRRRSLTMPPWPTTWTSS